MNTFLTNSSRNKHINNYSATRYSFIKFLPLLIFTIFFISAIIPIAAGTDGTTTSARQSNISFSMEFITDEPIEDGVLVLYPGDYYYFYLRLTNTGDINDNYSLTITGVKAGWVVNFPNKSTEIVVAVDKSDSPQDVLVVVSVPETAKKNDFSDLEFSATSVESTKTSTTVTHSLDLMILVDYMPPYILLETVDAEQEIEPGKTIASFNVEVKNLGYETVDYTPPDPADYQPPSGWTIEIPGGGSTLFTLEPAGSQTFFVNISASENVLAQESVGFLIEGYTSSLDTTILPLELSVKVKQIHSLTLNAPTSITVLSPLKEMSYQVSIKNNGNGPETLNLRLEAPDSTSGWRPQMTQSSIILPVGGLYSVKINYTPTIDAENGIYHFTLHADIMDQDAVVLTESFSTDINIKYVPDIAITDADIELPDTSLEADQTLLIKVTVHNYGIVPARNVSVDFKWTAEAPSPKDIQSKQIDLIPAGGEAETSIEWTLNPATSSIIVIVDPSNNTLEVDENNNIAYKYVFIAPQKVESGSDSAGSGGGVAGIGTIGAVVVLTALVSIGCAVALMSLNTEAGRYGFLSFVMPLYSKMRREDLLLHETREMVYDYVKSHPGEHFRSIMNKLSLTNGTLAHHLYTLEKQEFIKSERDGPYKRFYPRGYIFDGSVMEVNGIQKKILDTIEVHPGITQKRLASALTISPPTVNYHIKTLVGARLVELQRNGKETRLFRIKAE
ncbi:MAG: winged helix-turn-helix transcriptional regulator [Thermoplasmata archaeon]|nr:MAG: winged helix-turn-helix transcriptional regulator [Thermoplasmata archaeon]